MRRKSNKMEEQLREFTGVAVTVIIVIFILLIFILVLALFPNFSEKICRLIRKLFRWVKEKIQTALEVALPQRSGQKTAALKERLRGNAAEMPRIEQKMLFLISGDTGLQALKTNMEKARAEGDSAFYQICADSFLNKYEQLKELNGKYERITELDPNMREFAKQNPETEAYAKRLSVAFPEKKYCDELLRFGEELKTELRGE